MEYEIRQGAAMYDPDDLYTLFRESESKRSRRERETRKVERRIGRLSLESLEGRILL